MKKDNSVGVVVGRFQTPKLHAGHLHLLTTVTNLHSTLCVVLGDHCGNPTDRNPLNVAVRKQMILDLYPEAVVLSLADSRTDSLWSTRLDELLEIFCGKEVVLYGSRDSFISQYSGKHKTEVIKAILSPSASEIRSQPPLKINDYESFREGILHATTSRFPVTYPTVDVAVYRKTETGIEILVGEKKGDDGQCRFVGGFVDTKDETIDGAAKRELWEEVGMIETAPFEYVGSHKVEDRRYFLSKDSVITTLFCTEYLFGHAHPKDDLDDVHWKNIEELESILISEHIPLLKILQNYFNNKNL